MATTGIAESAQTLLAFWFSESSRARWFDSTPEFDEQIRQGFESTFQAALAGRLADWESSAEGALALVIALDQLPLNMYRGEPLGFSGEAPARAVADRAIARGLDAQLEPERRAFLYLPFMHSEDLADQDRSLQLYREAGLETRWAEHHRDIIQRFGRFPHRNRILGRADTPAEREYLESGQAFRG